MGRPSRGPRPGRMLGVGAEHLRDSPPGERLQLRRIRLQPFSLPEPGVDSNRPAYLLRRDRRRTRSNGLGADPQRGRTARQRGNSCRSGRRGRRRNLNEGSLGSSSTPDHACVDGVSVPLRARSGGDHRCGAVNSGVAVFATDESPDTGAPEASGILVRRSRCDNTIAQRFDQQGAPTWEGTPGRRVGQAGRHLTIATLISGAAEPREGDPFAQTASGLPGGHQQLRLLVDERLARVPVARLS
jgi:hypothetical protein